MNEVEAAPALTMNDVVAAKRLGCSVDWLRRQARVGAIPFVQMGRARRYTEGHLQQILAQREQVAADPWIRSPQSRGAQRRRRAG